MMTSFHKQIWINAFVQELKDTNPEQAARRAFEAIFKFEEAYDALANDPECDDFDLLRVWMDRNPRV